MSLLIKTPLVQKVRVIRLKKGENGSLQRVVCDGGCSLDLTRDRGKTGNSQSCSENLTEKEIVYWNLDPIGKEESRRIGNTRSMLSGGLGKGG